MNKEISIWKCKEHGEFETKTKNVPKCPVCKSAKLTFIRNKEIKLRVGGNYWENKANIILNDVELKQIVMPFGIVNQEKTKLLEVCGFSIIPFKEEVFKTEIGNLKSVWASTQYANGNFQLTLNKLVDLDFLKNNAIKFWYFKE
jgi:hypothetical protein